MHYFINYFHWLCQFFILTRKEQTRIGSHILSLLFWNVGWMLLSTKSPVRNCQHPPSTLLKKPAWNFQTLFLYVKQSQALHHGWPLKLMKISKFHVYYFRGGGGCTWLFIFYCTSYNEHCAHNNRWLPGSLEVGPGTRIPWVFQT